jgi:hypothetical protein
VSTVRQLKRKPARRPDPRTVQVSLDGDFDGWQATARADFPAGWLVDLASGDLARIVNVLDRIILDHNLPNSDDQLAEKMADVDPYEGLLAIATAVFDAIGTLPKR